MSEAPDQNAPSDTVTVANPFDPADDVSVGTISEDWQPQLDSQLVAGLLGDFEQRAGEQGRRIGLALLQGQPYHIAAMAGGITGSALSQWMRKDATIRQCINDLEAIGFSRSLESEAYRRAMAGNEDKQSGRMLELLLKSRSPRYREKTQVQMDVVHRAEAAEGGVLEGWADDGAQ